MRSKRNPNQPPVEHICLYCHRVFKVAAWRVRKGLGTFCGRECQSRSWIAVRPTLFWGKVARGLGCWLWLGACDRDGYGKYGHNLRAHRVAWELTFGSIPDGMRVLHDCDNPPCVRPKHLFLGTTADNNADRDAKDRQSKGARHWTHVQPERVLRGGQHGRATIQEIDVHRIRAMAANGLSRNTIARNLGIPKNVADKVLQGKTWRHVQ